MITIKQLKKRIYAILENFKNEIPTSIFIRKPKCDWDDEYCGIYGNGHRFIITISRGYQKGILLFALPFAIYHEIGHVYCYWENGQSHSRLAEVYADKFSIEQMVKYRIKLIWLRIFMYFVYRKFQRLGIYRTLYHYYYALVVKVPEEDRIDIHPFEIERFLYCWKYLIKLRLHNIIKRPS